MIISFLYIILAILGLSFLIFIHELGHYYMARRLGIPVDTFSIGFGRPIYTWMRDGVKWQIGWLLFGGYVRIGGGEPVDGKNVLEEQDGLLERKPLDRILVAFMGPFVNIVFALIAFTLLWMFGGREKNFSDYTNKIGWIDPKSELYEKGIRPGDEITAYNHDSFKGSKDHLTAPMMSEGHVEVQGNHFDQSSNQKIPFDYTVKTYPHPAATEKDIVTIGILNPASYVIYDRLPNGKDNPLPEGSPMQESGVHYGDRIVWVDGVAINSNQELAHVLNDSKALLTIKHGNEIQLRRVPRVTADELRLDAHTREELVDWQFESGLNGTKAQNLYVIPYNLNNSSVVDSRAKFIDQDKEAEFFPQHLFSSVDLPLEAGDQIVAVDGVPVEYSYQLLAKLQQHHVNIIVERDAALSAPLSWKEANAAFDSHVNPADLQQLVATIGSGKENGSAGNLVLLKPVVPKMRKDFELSPENKLLLATEVEAQKKEIEGIADPEKRAQMMQALDHFDKQLFLGLPTIRDEKVQYNPGPLALFGQVFDEIWHTLGALFTGSLNPKWLSGPIGIVQVVHDNSMVSLKEALFWLGAISLNLGILNLLPLPVLDGGTILFALCEMVTGRKLKPKTLEKLIIPFALLLIGFFIFLTYHDVSRIFKMFF